ncbi:MAG: DUF3224 domain-containing protein [Acidimicrobiales bacterium]|nr:DUF3224 domain-containing protein [Acidimicrobiales bacterium]
MSARAIGAFEISLQPDDADELGGVVHRMVFTKSFSGDLDGVGEGVMLSGGDPQTGNAGYVAVEVFRGRVHGREGTVLFQQFGQMDATGQRLLYEIVGGSGTGELAGISGRLELTIDAAGHHVELEYELPDTD